MKAFKTQLKLPKELAVSGGLLLFAAVLFAGDPGLDRGLCMMAMLLSREEEFRGMDMDKVIRMCLIHDLGEAFTGDIPAFEKSAADEKKEDAAYDSWVAGFPDAQRREFQSLLTEMGALETREAKLYKALDKVEALIQHNESPLSTWLPLEYELQLTYGTEQMAFSPYMKALRVQVDDWTREKIAKG